MFDQSVNGKVAFSFDKPVYGVAETLKLLGISRTKLYELVKKKQLKRVKCGRRTLFHAAALAVFLDNLQPEGDRQ